ncbi:ATP-grasp domain-containing protein [Desulfovermiculus halophilus]|uniref:ATP-grasp domain-containing protein n=1 Tax=Desulfovermiculus halophilus TaxID=339722 RepID=UPI0006869EEF|nr:hypothetical protein [Desulfovermiculus halophilus]
MYFVSLHHQIRLDVNLPALAPLDERSRDLLHNAAGVLMPKYFSPIRYRQIQDLAPNHFPRLGPRYLYRGKASQIRLFRQLELPHPRTRIYDTPAQALHACRRNGLPFTPCVLKGDKGGGGSAVFPVSSLADLDPCLCSLPSQEPVLLQEWVDNEGMDLRVVIIGEMTESYFRMGHGQFYNNVAKGGRIDHHIRPDKQDLGRRMGRHLCTKAGIDVAGLDLMFPPSGPPLFIEINFLFGRKGIGGRTGYDRLFHQAVQSWMQSCQSQGYRKKHPNE